MTARDLIALMDEQRADRAVLLQGNYYGFQNLASWEAMEDCPQRLTGAAMYDPYAQGTAQVRAHLFEGLAFPAVKFECSVGSELMAFRPQLQLDDAVMDEAFSYAAQRGQVIILDIGKCASPSWQVEAARRAFRRRKRTSPSLKTLERYFSLQHNLKRKVRGKMPHGRFLSPESFCYPLGTICVIMRLI